jgi:2-keto-3-deoxy-L-rhamnonate aldolase RhmA
MNRLHAAIENAHGKPLLGAALYSYDPIFLEIAAHLGFSAIWIEMEHAAISFAEAADLCRMAAGTGMLTMIRVPDARRDSVLKAAECGPDILDVPMVDSPAIAQDLVRYANFAPKGERGVFSVSRAVKYGLVANVTAEQQQLNQQLALLVQIETQEALAQIDAIAAVPQVDLFIGPADLAASLGVPGETTHPTVLHAAARIMESARRNGKKVITACAATEMHHWSHLGVDLFFCANNIACMRSGAQAALHSATQLLDGAQVHAATDSRGAA